MTDKSGLDGPRLPQAQGDRPGHLVILVHGYGADGQDLLGLGQHWQGLLAHTYFVAPNGPEPCAGAPFGYQWFPISRIDPEEVWRGAQAVGPKLDSFITEELDRHGLDESQCALVGFSQGTMLSLHVGLRRKKPLAAILGYSGALPGPDKLADEIGSKPPVLLIHGDADPLVPPQATELAAQTLGQAGVPVQWHFSKGIGHGIAPDGLELGGRFLAAALEGRLPGGNGAEGQE